MYSEMPVATQRVPPDRCHGAGATNTRDRAFSGGGEAVRGHAQLRNAEQTWLAVRSLQTSFVTRPPHHHRRQRISATAPPRCCGGCWREALGGAVVDARRTGTVGFPCGVQHRDRGGAEGGRRAEYILWSTATPCSRRTKPSTLLLADELGTHESAGILGPSSSSREEPDHVASAGIAYS